MKKRIISFCLVLCMLLSYVPAGVLAAEDESFNESVEEFAEEQEKNAEVFSEETAEESPEETTEDEPSEEPRDESAPEEAQTEAPAVPVVLTATAEDGVQVVLTAEAGAFMDGETALTAEQLSLTAHVVTGFEAEIAQAGIDSSNLVAATTYDVCVMYGGVELQPAAGKSVNVAFVVPAVPEEAEVVEVVHHNEEGGVETVVEKQEVDASVMVEVAPVVEELVSEVAEEFTEETVAVVEETVAALPEEAVEVLTGTVPSFSYYTVVFTYESKTALVDCATTKNDLTILSESVGIPLKENTDVILTAELYEDASCQGSAAKNGILRNERGGDILRVYHDEQMKWYLDCVEEFEGSYGLKLTTDKGQVYTVTLQCAEQTERRAYIRSALTHETEHLRVSELLEVVALGFSPNADLEYKYEIKGNSGNTRYASLNVYNSMNQLEEYSGECDSDATTNNSGVTPDGKNYRYFALQDKSNQTRCWNQDRCTVTVTVTNRNKRSETAVATYSGFEPSSLKTDVESTLLIVFVGEEQKITTLYGLNGVVHIDCSNSEVRDDKIEDTSIATCDRGSITGMSAGVTSLTVTVEKDHDCDHHSVSNGQWAGTVAEACKNTVYVVNQPKVTGEGEITFEDVPVGVTITLNGVSLTSTDPSVPLVFKGLTPGESYTVTASVYDTGTKAEAITEAEIIVPDGRTEHTYIFVHQDASGATLEGASVKIEPTTLIGGSKELRITPIPPEGYRATSAEGSYNIFIPIIPFIIPRTPSFVLQKDGSFVVDEGSMDPIGNITITITYEQHKHSWKYESAKTAADNDTIKAYCVNTGHTGVGTAENPDKVVISAQNWTYDGNGHGATLSQNSVGGVNGLTIQYRSWNGSTYVPLSGTPTNVGQYRASVTAGDATAYTTYNIEALDLSELATAEGPADRTYTGSAIKPTDVVVSYGDKELVLGTDYTLEYGENKNAGKGTVIVSFRGNYTGSLTQEFDIFPKPVIVKADDKSVVAGESAPEFTAKVTGTVNEETVVYTLSCTYVPGVSEAGEYDITPTGDATQGNYTVTFEAGKLIVSEAEVLVIVTSSAEYEGVYDGEPHGSAVEVTGSESVTVKYSTDGGETWSDDYPTITDVGEITVSVKATALGCKDAEASYVLKVTAAPATVKAKDNGKIYDESDPALTAEVTGLFGTDKLTYTVTRAEGEDVGTYAITAFGDEEQGNYTVSYEPGTFTITAKNLTLSAKVDEIPDQTYTGELITPKPDVYDGDKKLTEGTDFVYEYTDADHDNTTIGENTGIVKVIFIGNYEGATSVEFAIVEGEQSYTVVYTYNGTLGSGPLTGGTGKYGEWTTVKADKQTNYLDAAYALDSIVQHRLELDNDKNIVYVNYARDSIGKNPEGSDDPSDIAVPDGVPDKYQVIVSFSIENGIWDEETNYDGVIADIYTLCKYDDATEKWVALTGEDIPTLTVPTGMKPAAGYQQSAEKGEWLKPQPVADSPVTEKADYTYSYGTQKDQFTVTVSVENGTVDATLVDGKTTVVYGEDCVLTFTPNTGYTLSSVTADEDAKTLMNGVFTFTEVKEDHEIEVVYEAGTYGYNVQYFYDEKPGDAPEGAKTTGEGTYGGQSDLSLADFKELTVTGYAFDKLENCTITETAAANIAKVYYAKDEKGDADDPENKGDRIPDKYQATITYAIENGTWAEGDKAVKTYVHTLCELDDSGEWVPVEETPTLKGTVPANMKPDAAYQQATGQWTPSVPTEKTEVTESVDYLYSYGEEQDKFTIGISVTGGKAYPDDASKTVTYGGSYKVWFVADEGMVLDTVMLTVGEEDPVAAKLSADGSFTFTDVKENRSIAVTFSADEKGTDPEAPDVGDGVPDKYQVPVTFTVVNGVIKDTEDTSKTVYVTLFDKEHSGEWSEEGEGHLTAEQIPATSGNDGYTTETGWDTNPAEATITGEKTFTYTYELGKFKYSIEYYYDGEKDADETDTDEALFESATTVTADEKKEHGGKTYALDTIEQCESIGTDEAANVVKVNYAKDEKGEEGDEGDGIPDKYQATVTYSIYHGTWDGKEDKADKTAFFTLKERDGNGWKDTSKTLGDTIPTDMKADEEYTQSTGKWDAEIGSDTAVTGNASYKFSFGDEKNEYTITVNVVNGKAVPGTTGKTVKYGEGYEVCFQPEDSSFVLDTVTVNGDPAELDSYNTYAFTEVKEDKEIVVTFSKDEKGDADDPENKGDGIPDKYQLPVTFTFVNGVIAGTEDSSKTVYVTKLDEKGERSETGKAKLTSAEIPASEGKEGYVKAETFWNKEPVGAEITEAATFIGSYELGKFGYSIEYYYDGEPGAAPTDAPTGDEQTFGQPTTVKVEDYKDIEVEGYALDTIEQCESIGTDEAANVVKVNYAKDEKGEEGDEGDGIPDKYQATVTYSIYHGTWDGEDSADKTAFFTLKKLEDGQWKDDPKSLGNTIPTGMEPDEEYKSAEGEWDVAITAATLAHDGDHYTYSYGDEKDKFEITVSVVGGTADPAAASAFVEYGQGYEVSFTADEGFALDTVTVNGDPAELTDNAYSFTNVKENQTIVVVYAEDVKGDSTDPENKGDGIPDKYQVPVTFTVENGVFEGTEDSTKTIYVTLLDEDGKPSEEGEGALTAEQIPATIGNEGYTTDKGWDTDPAEATITGEKTFTYTYELGKFGYSIEYYYDGVKGEVPADAPTEGEQTFGQSTDEKVEDYKDIEVEGYALDTIEQCESIGTDEAANVVKVNYAKDEKGEEGDEGDGIPDKYQATVTYSIYHGTWDGKEDKADKTAFFTLKERDGNGWKDTSKTLGDTIPTDMKADEEYTQSTGKWDAEIGSDTAVTGNASYKFSYGEEKNEYTITVTVVNGKSIPGTTSKTVKHGEDYEVGFLPNSGFVLDTVTVNDAAAELTDNVYTFTNVTDDMTIVVTFSEDAKGDADDPENKGDGIPDKYQVKVTFTVEDGEFADGSTTKTVYATKLDEAGKWDENGKADVSTVVPTVTPKEGYVEGTWSPDPTQPVETATDFTNKCAKGEFNYSIEYYCDDQKIDTPDGAPEGNKQTFGEATAEKFDDYKEYAPEGYALDTIEQCESIGTDEAANVVKVNYAKDEKGKEGDEGDGIPDKYQATVTYKIHNGSWDGEGDKADKTAFFTLKLRDGNGWKDDPQTLGDTVPANMEPDEEYKSAEGEWDVAITADTPVADGDEYTYSYGDEKDKIKITVAVENGTADPSNTEVEVEYGGSYTVSFKPNTGYKLDSVKVDGEAAELTEGAYTFENVTTARTIEVSYVADEFAYSIQYYYDGVKGNKEDGGTDTYGATTTVDPTDPNTVDGVNYMLGSVEQCEITSVPENNIVRVYYLSDMLGNDGDDPTNPNKPDNIPDLYQVVVTFKAVNGTVDGTNAKTAVVLTKVDEESNPSVSGSVKLSAVPTPQPTTGYVTPESGFWSPTTPDTDTPITEDETYIATFVKGQYAYTIQYYYDNVAGDKVEGNKAEYGATVSAEYKTTRVYTDKTYAFDSITPCTIGTTEASNIVKVYYLADEKGGVNQNNPDEPDLPDGIPDIYEAIVKFSVTEGTGTVTKNRYAVVPLKGEDGKPSATGKGSLTTDQLPETVPATGYVAPETGLWSPTEPDTSTEITENCEYVATYVKGQYAYSIQYFYDGTSGDTVDGGKAEFGTTPSVTPEPKRTYSDKTYAYDSITLCTIGTVEVNNIVKVFYGTDDYGPESLEEGDGIPDSHQAKVVFHIDGGTWDGSDTNDKTYVYPLETQGDDGQWTAVAPAPVLGGDVPIGMKPASGNEDKVGIWHLETKPVTIDANTPVTGNATYVYNYDQKFEADKTAAENKPDLGEDLTFTITVENKTEAETLTDIVVSEAEGNLIVKVDGVALENPVRVYTIETLAAGANTVLTVAHTVTEADIAKGSYANAATVSCQGAVIELTDEGETAEVNNEITTTKTIDKLNTRPTGEGGKYALGDTVRYVITATNTGNQTLSNVTVTEQEGVTILADDPATYTVTCDPSTGVYTATCIGTLAPGAKLTVYAELTVSGEDILAGKVLNAAAVTSLAPDGETPVEPEEQPKDETAETVPVDAKLDFEKSAKVYDKDSGEEKSAAAVGDTVAFTFHVVNSGNVPQKSVTVSDEMLGYTGTPTDLDAGEEYFETKEYTVTEADLLSGSIENSATVTAEDIVDPESGEPIVTEVAASIKVPTEEVKAEFDFSKAFVAEEPAKEYYLADDTVSYALTVKNAGNVSLKNVVVSEQEGMTILPGDGYKVEDGKAVIETLAPDATVTVNVSHKLTEEDVLKGTLTNEATVKADKITDPKTGEDIEPKAEASNSDAPLGKTEYTVVYKYDGTEGTAPSATAPVKGEGCVGDVTEVTGVPATASYYGVSYALDEIVQIELVKDAAENVVTVNYAADKLGNDPDDPEKPAKPDGVPDKYQATVIFTVENGYWDNGRDKDQKVVYTLFEQVEGEWKLKDPAPTLETIPAVGEGKSGYPLAYGWKEAIDETTPVEVDVTYTYHFGSVTVEPIGDKTYTGDPIVPDASEIVVLDEQGQPIESEKYEVSVSNNTNVGEAVVTITFKGDLSGEVETEFDIVPKQHNDDHDNDKPRDDDPGSPDYNPGDFCASVDPIAPQVATGEPIKPAVTVRDEKGKALVPDVDYEIVGYEDNVDPGIATVKIKLKGNYEGELETTFEISSSGYLIDPPTDPRGKLYEKYEVDGETDTVEEVGGEELIVRESPDAFVVTGINYSTDEDPHSKYPTNMTAEILQFNPETGRFDVVKSYFDLIRYEGCSIRIGSNKRGLRVVSSISREFKSELINEGVELNGKVYRLVEYGTLMAWTNELGANTLTMACVDQGIAKYGIAFSGQTDALYQQTDERDYWCNVVTSADGSLSDAQVCSDMTLRPYLVMAAEDGATFYIYGGEVVRSIGSVAVQNQGIYAPGTWEDDAIEELVDIYKEKGSEY